MKKTGLTLIMLFLGIGILFSQTSFVHRNIGLDSLVVLMQRVSKEKIYYMEDEGAKNLTFTVNVGSTTLLDDIKDQLKEKGYTVSYTEGYAFVLKGMGIKEALPENWYAQEKPQEKAAPKQEPDYNALLQGGQNLAVSQNKVYQIGDKNNKKKGGKAYLSGYVRDSRTGEPVIGVNLFNKATQTYAQSDAAGLYKILLPLGETSLDVSGYSLEDSKVHLLVYNDGNLDIVVQEKVYALTGVVVSAESANKVRNNEIGIEKVRMDRMKKVPVVFGEADVVKIILTLPGVKSVGEAGGGFNVRGGATDQNLVLFNGGTVYNPSHLFGMFSGFNPDIVSDIELYKSSIPVEFGGRISSVLDVNSREGNNKEITGSLGLGLLSARGHIEGPVTSKTNFIAGVRGTYSDWLLGILPDNSEYNNGTASFYDVTAGLTHRFNEKHSIHLNGYWSTDAFKFSVDTSYRYENANGSIKWRWNFHEKHKLELAAGYDMYGYATYDKYNPVNSYELSFKIRQAYGKLKFKSLLNKNHTLIYGVDAINYDLTPGSYLPYGNESLVVPDVLAKEKALEGAGYFSHSWNMSDRFFLDYGLRYSIFRNGETTYTNPEIRISGRMMLTDELSFKAGFNSLSQYIHMLSNTTAMSPTDIWKLSDNNICPQQGWQAAGGLYANIFRNKVEASLEGYYKRMENYLDYKSGAILIMNKNIAEDVVTTQGEAYGVELMLKKPLGKLNGWFAYTYSKTRLREDGDRGDMAINGGDWYDASYDKPHDVKLVANYKFTQRISLSINGDYASGRPITIPVAKYMYDGGYKLHYSDRNGHRTPDYFRVDAAMNFEPTHKLKAFTHFSFTVGVYNITGRKNVYSIYFDTDDKGEIKGHKLSIFGAPIPYVNFNFKF